MFIFYTGYILSPGPGQHSIDSLYNLHYKHIILALKRTIASASSLEESLANHKPLLSQVISVMMYTVSCADMKSWMFKRKEIMPSKISFYKLSPDRVSYLCLGTKVLTPERIL